MPPFRELTREEEAAVAADIQRSGAEVVWVGIGVPKQEKWMARMTPRLRSQVLIGVGAAFDFHGGLIPQAPARMQRLGLEWAFRLAQEPRRLWRRYLRYNPRFVVGFARQWARERLTLSLASTDAQSQPRAGSERRGRVPAHRHSIHRLVALVGALLVALGGLVDTAGGSPRPTPASEGTGAPAAAAGRRRSSGGAVVSVPNEAERERLLRR